VARMVKLVRTEVPDALIIGFPRGAGVRYLGYKDKTGVSAVGLDWTVPMDLARAVQQKSAVQGNLDPMRLVAGGKALRDGVDHILDGLGKGPLVFNLGHGITPETPVAHVEVMLDQVRNAT
jgi:uroporphyrinogen decarboxylase